MATGDDTGETEGVPALKAPFSNETEDQLLPTLCSVSVPFKHKRRQQQCLSASSASNAPLTPNSTLHSNHHMPSAPPWAGQICCRLVLAITAPYRSLLVICLAVLSEITPVEAGGRGKREAGMRRTGRRSDTATLGASRLERAATLSVLLVARRTPSKRKAKQSKAARRRGGSAGWLSGAVEVPER